MRASLNSLSSALSNDETLHDQLGPADFVAALNAGVRAGVLALDATWRWALAQHRTSFSQPGHSRQRAVGPRCGRWSRSRSYKLGIFTTAPPAQSPMRLRPGMWSPVSLRGDSRPSRGSAALTFPTSGFSTERVGGPHAWSQMHGRLRRRCRAEEDRSPAFVPRAASAERYDSTCYSEELHDAPQP